MNNTEEICQNPKCECGKLRENHYFKRQTAYCDLRFTMPFKSAKVETGKGDGKTDNPDYPFPAGHSRRMRAAQEWSLLANQVVGAEIIPVVESKDVMLSQLTNTVTALALAIDPTASHGPETAKLVAYAKTLHESVSKTQEMQSDYEKQVENLNRRIVFVESRFDGVLQERDQLKADKAELVRVLQSIPMCNVTSQAMSVYIDSGAWCRWIESKNKTLQSIGK